jgi:hypothetical protein
MRAGILILLFFACGTCSAQSSYEPLDHDFSDVYDKYLNDKNSNTHTCIKPYLHEELGTLQDSVLASVQMPWINKRDTSKTERDRSQLGISPVFVLEPGFNLAALEPAMEMAGGLQLTGHYKEKLAWDLVCLGGRSSFVNYVDTFIKFTNTVPELGYSYGAAPTYNYQYLSGSLSYSPNKYFNFQAGRDKHFWGDGYRSLFLSDHANAYPFASITGNVWHLKYTVMYAMHKDLAANTGLKTDERNKFATFHYLSWNVWKRLNIGFFESIVWQGNDSTRSRGYDVNYLDPVIFFRPVEYSLGSADNALLGGSFKVKVAKKQQFYGQVILDEFFLKQILARNGWWANKQGVQAGFRSFDLFKVKGLDMQTELNIVRPYTYSHGSVQQNYGHFHVPLAHPLGANFKEWIGIMTYRVDNWLLEGKLVYNIFGADTSGINFGGNIFRSYLVRPHEYDNYIGQGGKTTHIYAGARLAYLFTKHGNMEATGGITLRAEVNPGKNLYTAYFYAGIKTALWNTYRDY